MILNLTLAALGKQPDDSGRRASRSGTSGISPRGRPRVWQSRTSRDQLPSVVSPFDWW